MCKPKTATDMAIESFFMDLQETHSISTALADLYGAGVEAGEENILDDPEEHGLRSVER